MRANHAVTLGLCVGLTGLATLPLAAAGCGTDTFGTCSDNNTCGGGGDAGADGETDSSSLVDSSMTGDTGNVGDSGTGDSTSVDTGAPGDSSSSETSVSCEAGTVDCNGTCVNEQSDPNHCGSCSKVCPGPEAGMGMAQCTTGMCSVTCNGSTTLDCSGTCFDPSDPDNCGSCGHMCPGPTNGNGSATCTGSTSTCGISCNGGFHTCSGACDSNSDDPSVTTDPCILANAFGIFVSPSGSDAAGCGTMASPCKTVGHAMDLAKAGVSRVYACGSAGTYNESLVVGSSRDGVTVFGGLNCAAAQWVYNATDKAVVAPSAQGYALQVTGLTTGVTFQDFGFQSQAATSPGQSSIAVFVSGSAHVLLERCTAQAGAGMAGQDQVQPQPYSSAAPNGNSGVLLGGGNVVQNMSCSTSTGGAGGNPGPTGGDGNDGTPDVASNKGVASAQDCGKGSTGQNGAAGSAGTNGAGAATWASFVSTGWTPTAAQAGGPGSVAQGGGGGAALDPSGGGGSGGAGGCGGVGGPAGSGGGSSIDVLAYQSSIDLESSTLTAASAGRGGDGAAGQGGQGGGTKGNGFANACAGGKGGTGGNGGPGGGGAGGLSVGVVWFGTAPTVNGVSTPTAATMSGWMLGTAGTGGAGGSGVSCASAGNDCGLPGTQGAVVQFP